MTQARHQTDHVAYLMANISARHVGRCGLYWTAPVGGERPKSLAESVFSGNLCFRRHGAWLQFAGWTPGVGLRTLSKSRKAWCGISHLNEHSCQPLRRSCALLPDWPKAIVDTREKRAVKTSMQTEQRSISCLQQPFSASLTEEDATMVQGGFSFVERKGSSSYRTSTSDAVLLRCRVGGTHGRAARPAIDVVRRMCDPGSRAAQTV